MRLTPPLGLDAVEVANLPVPTPGRGEVLVEVAAATINPADILVASGGAMERMPGSPPWTPGWDLAGTVAHVGDGVDPALVGRRILGFSQWFRSGRGTHAAVVALPRDDVAVASDALPSAELTTFGLNGLTAWQALEAAEVPPGGTVVVGGATGAVGGFVAAMAEARGLRVVPVTRRTDPGDLRGTRADALVNCAPVDARLLDGVRDGGVAISVTRPMPEVRGIRSERVGVRPDATQLRTVLDLAERGVLRADVRRAYPVDQARAAYRDFAERTAPGRVVLTF